MWEVGTRIMENCTKQIWNTSHSLGHKSLISFLNPTYFQQHLCSPVSLLFRTKTDIQHRAPKAAQWLRITSDIKEALISLLCSYFLTRQSTIFCMLYVCVCVCVWTRNWELIFPSMQQLATNAFQSEPTVLYLQATHATAMKWYSLNTHHW